MQELCAGVLQCDFSGIPDETYTYVLLFCEEGQYAVCTPELCISVLPGQCMLFRRSRFMELPVALTGREKGGVLLIDPQRLCIQGVSAGNMPELQNEAFILFSEKRISTILHEMLLRTYSGKMMEHKLAEVFLLLGEPLTPAVPRICKSTEFRIARDAFQFAMENMQEHIRIQELAGRAGKSPTMMKLCFQHLFGISAFSLLRREKMHRAAVMLRNTNLRIIDVASRAGYDNCSKFSKAFSDVMGMPPRAYRKQNTVRLEQNEPCNAENVEI